MSFVDVGPQEGAVHQPLFKYMRMEHAARLLSEGIVRIGTLYAYRDIEELGRVVGDDTEGTKSASMFVPDLTMAQQEHIPEFVRDRISLLENTTIRMVNSKFVIAEQSPNYYVYSVAEEYDPEQMSAFGYNTCVKIGDPAGFFASLCRCFRHHARSGALHRCVYMPRDVPHTAQHGIHPALIKDPSYARQKEWRFVWEPTGTNIRPVVLRCRKLSRHCSLVV